MNDELNRIGDEFWAVTLESSPTNATLPGYHDHDAALEDPSREVEDEHIASFNGFAATAEAIDPDPLTANERISREVLMFEASTAADDHRSRMAEFAVDPFNGIQVVFQQIACQIPITEPEHAEAMVEKRSRMGRMLDHAIGRHSRGGYRCRIRHQGIPRHAAGCGIGADANHARLIDELVAAQ